MIEIQRKTRHSAADIFGGSIVKRLFLVTEHTASVVKETASFVDVNDSMLLECLIRSDDGLEAGLVYYKSQGFVSTGGREKVQYRHGDPKSSRLLMSITTIADKKLDKYASKLKESRGEILECAVRGGGLEYASALIQQLRQEP